MSIDSDCIFLEVDHHELDAGFLEVDHYSGLLGVPSRVPSTALSPARAARPPSPQGHDVSPPPALTDSDFVFFL